MEHVFYDLEEQQQNDLLTWLNVSQPDADDLNRLVALIDAGQFRAWDCEECGERCYYAMPDDWSHFQGVRQVDYASYPGNVAIFQPDYLRELCDSCRAHWRR